MDVESIVATCITGICTAPILIIGIVQYRSEKPVGFWSGKEPPEKEQITDLKAYNHKHGLMWIVYGLGFLLCFMGGFLYKEEMAAILGIAECVGGLFAMIVYHNILDHRYCRKGGGK